MNKIKTTKKEIGQNYRILGTEYCTIQNLLYYYNPIAYSSGVYGWACDYYDIDGVIIATGYSPLKSKNMVEDYGIIHKYEVEARGIKNDYAISSEDSKKAINGLLSKMLKELKI